MQQSELDFIQSLRQSSHYIEEHRGKTFVLYLPGDLLSDEKLLLQLAQDITLLHNLGINILLAMGATAQIDQALAAENISWENANNCRITTQQILPILQKTIGVVRSELEAIFCRTSYQQTRPLSLVSGNWVIAQPKGVINGVDYQHTGVMRKANTQAIQSCLNSGQIVLLTPLSYSLTGEVFNLNTFEQACEVAKEIKADKLMIFDSIDTSAFMRKELMKYELETSLHRLNDEDRLKMSKVLSISASIPRIHVLDQSDPSSLLLELFTRDGTGLMIFNDHYHQIRAAEHEDISAILELIAPLEEKGILVKRSRERLELEIHNFILIERDHRVIACAALYPSATDAKMAELACLAVSKEYQGQQLGEQLLNFIEANATQQNIDKLFLLTTHTYHWFIEHGFVLSQIADLPAEKQELYNYQRQSKVLIKALETAKVKL